MGRDQHSGTGCRGPRAPAVVAAHRRPPAPRAAGAAAIAASRSAPSRAYGASAAAGSARTTRVLPGGQRGEPLADQVPQPAPDLVADHGVADRLGHDEAGAGRCGGSAPASRAGSGEVVAVSPAVAGRSGARRRRHGRRVGHRGPLRRSRCCAAVAARRPARLPSPRTGPVGSGRQAGRGPWRGGSRGWRGRHGCACAAGSRGSSRAGGCSAGRCACSRQALRFRTPRARDRRGRVVVQATSAVAHDRCCPAMRNLGDAGKRRGQQAPITLAEGERAAAPAYAGAAMTVKQPTPAAVAASPARPKGGFH